MSTPETSSVRGGGPPAATRLPLRLRWENVDRNRSATYAAIVGLVIGALLAIFGLPPVDTHGPLHQLGVMMPSCGGTRALRFTMLGELGKAFAYNPLSPILVLGAVLALVRHAVGMATRRWLNVRVVFNRVTIALLTVGIVALWVNQQLHVELIGP